MNLVKQILLKHDPDEEIFDHKAWCTNTMDNWDIYQIINIITPHVVNDKSTLEFINELLMCTKIPEVLPKFGLSINENYIIAAHILLNYEKTKK